MVIEKLIQSIPPPSRPIGSAIVAVIEKRGMDSLEMIACISADDWKPLLESEKSIISTQLQPRVAESTDKAGESADTENSSGATGPGETDATGSSESKEPVLDSGTLTQLKCYGVALSGEAKRWLKMSHKEAAEAEVGKIKDSDDDAMLTALVTELTAELGSIPVEVIPPARVVKLLKKGPASYVELRLLTEAEASNPRKKLKTTTAGVLVEVLDDEADADPKKAGQPGKNRPEISIGDWMVAFPKYMIALAMCDKGCRANFSGLIRYQTEVGRLITKAHWEIVANIEKRFRRDRVRALVATGVDLWKCYADPTYSGPFFTQALAEEVFSDRIRFRGGEENRSRKGGKGKGKGKGGKSFGKTTESADNKKSH